MGRPVDWPEHLTRFHARHPGITEEILSRCRDDGSTPYRWLIDGVDPQARILDVGCGSAPARPDGSGRWLGIDRSAPELARAVAAGRGPLARADAVALPVAAGSIDVVTAAMSLMLVDPLEGALEEIARVLRPGGQLRLLLPAQGPLRARDAVRYLRLFWAVRSITHFPPSPLRRHASDALAPAGLQVVDDRRRRFEHRAETAADGSRFVASWYLPHTPPRRLERGRARAGGQAPFRVGVPLRRLIARRRQVDNG